MLLYCIPGISERQIRYIHLGQSTPWVWVPHAYFAVFLAMKTKQEQTTTSATTTIRFFNSCSSIFSAGRTDRSFVHSGIINKKERNFTTMHPSTNHDASNHQSTRLLRLSSHDRACCLNLGQPCGLFVRFLSPPLVSSPPSPFSDPTTPLLSPRGSSFSPRCFSYLIHQAAPPRV